MSDNKIYALIDYEDEYVQPLVLEALKARIPAELLVLIKDVAELPSPDSRLLQWRQYESIDFDHLLEHSSTSLANSYIIRKALIRKHYLSTTVAHWLTKNPESALRKSTKPSVEFEVDYAEFLDEALDAAEAWELRESWTRNETKTDEEEKEWWILKPGMSERGQGIRLFSSEEELTAIFEEWDPPSDDEEDEEDEDDEVTTLPQHSRPNSPSISPKPPTSGIITSQLRHFIAQPYIHPPLLLPSPHPSANRKFHLRTYVLATGSLQIHLYKPILALFAGSTYLPPTSSTTTPENLPSHLTNTCLQSGEREGSVHAFWSLPSHLPNLSDNWKEDVFAQVCASTGQLFEAAARSMAVHLQTLPNSFEVFGVDFMVDAEGVVWLLEVNAFPDFAQTGAELRGLVAGLVAGVVGRGVLPFFGVEGIGEEEEKMVRVLDVDLGRR